MSLLARFDPPAFMGDFNSIPGQLDAWHRAVSAWFDDVVERKEKLTGATPQYYSAAKLDPGGALVEQAITWNAFPKEMLRRYGRGRALQLADSLWPIERYRSPSPDPALPEGKLGVVYRPQEEYCEWHVSRNSKTNLIERVTFTSEPPEYWQALFGSIPGAGTSDLGTNDISFPGDKKMLLQLYRDLVSPEVELDDLIGKENVSDQQGNPLVIKGEYNIYNKWNTTHGIAHLNSPPNSLVAEIQLGGDATILYEDPQGRLLVEPDALISYANYGGPNRNSDPTIGSTVNALARLGAFVTLRNPVGLYMDHIDLSGWQPPGSADISEFIRIVRGAPGMIERLVVEPPPGHELTLSDLMIAGEPLRYGGQIAECITVKLVGLANIVSPPISSPRVSTMVRSLIDPHEASIIIRAAPRDADLPPGTVEAFRGEGAVSGEKRKKKFGRAGSTLAHRGAPSSQYHEPPPIKDTRE